MTGWTVAYVRKLASIRGWRRTATRPARYDLSDVARYVRLTNVRFKV